VAGDRATIPRVLISLLAVAALLAAAGCVVIPLPGPVSAAKGSATATTPVPASSQGHPAPTLATYLVSRGRLKQVARAGTPAKASAQGVTETLLAGPTSAERGAGLSSAIPAGTRLNSVDIGFDRIAHVDLSREFLSGGGSAPAQLRVAQLVYALTQLPGVTGVLFSVDGQRVEQWGHERIDLMQPQTRADFADVAP
jgi:hypothetical protein